MAEAKNIHSILGFAKGKRTPSKRVSVPFGNFITSIPPSPLVDYSPNYIYPMDGNDAVGDCVVAGWDHFRQVVTGLLTGTQQNFTQDQIWSFYKTQNPNFDPNGISTTNGPGSSADAGMDIQTFLEYLVAQKYILGFASIDYTNEAEFKAAVYIGLGVITGVVVRDIQMNQYNQGTWDYVVSSPVDGGHCVPFIGYLGQPSDQVTCVTWARLINCTQAFITNQMDEAWFILTQAHVDHPGFRNNFNLAAFSQSVSDITNGKVIIPVPTTPPTPTPTPAPWPYIYFKPTEQTGGGHTVSELKPQLIQALDTMRGLAGVPFTITSGFRTVAENAAVGGVPNSAHLVGLAADISVTDSTRQKVMKGILSSNIPCFTEDCTAHIHVDIDSAIHLLGDGIISASE
jgi:hypothetical protein